jgi:hypothetical protein
MHFTGVGWDYPGGFSLLSLQLGSSTDAKVFLKILEF